MTVTWKQLAQAVLTGTPANIYQINANTTATITAASAWNPTGANVVVDVYIAPNAGAASDATHVGRVTVAAGKTSPVFDLINQKMGSQQILFAAGNGCTITVSGAEST